MWAQETDHVTGTSHYSLIMVRRELGQRILGQPRITFEGQLSEPRPLEGQASPDLEAWMFTLHPISAGSR
jgi:hypothetical protein